MLIFEPWGQSCGWVGSYVWESKTIACMCVCVVWAAQRLCSLCRGVLRLTSGEICPPCGGLRTHPPSFLSVREFCEEMLLISSTLWLVCCCLAWLSEYWEDVHKASMSVLHCIIVQPLTWSYTKTQELYLGSERELATICPLALKFTQPDVSQTLNELTPIICVSCMHIYALKDHVKTALTQKTLVWFWLFTNTLLAPGCFWTPSFKEVW